MKRIVYWGFSFFVSPRCYVPKIRLIYRSGMWEISGFLKIKGIIEVVKADQNTYTVKFSDDICVFETQGFETIIFEKSTLHRIYTLKGNIREEYKKGRRTIFNFPLNPGKQWKDAYSAVSIVKGVDTQILDYYEIYKVLGWEDVEVKAGKFKAIKLEVIIGHEAKGSIPSYEATNLYWYSPDVKHFVKCQYDPVTRGFSADLFDWELSSFKVKK